MYLIIRKTYVRTAKYIYHNKKNRKTAKSLKKMVSRVSVQLPVEVTSHWEMIKRVGALFGAASVQSVRSKCERSQCAVLRWLSCEA